MRSNGDKDTWERITMATKKDGYVCSAGCGGTKQVAKGGRAPSCCGKPMKKK